MGQHRIKVQQIAAFESYLKREERSAGTIENYLRRVREFTAWLNGEEVDKERAGAWKLHLMSMGRSSGTINGALVAVNQFFKFLGWQECVVKGLRIQRKLFRDDRRELTRNEYERLLAAAHGLGREPAGSADGDHLCHRNPCQRGAVYYGRGGSLGPG